MEKTYYLIYRFDYESNQEYFHSIYTDYDSALIAEKLLMKQDPNANYKIESKKWSDLFEITHYASFGNQQIPLDKKFKDEIL